MLSAYCHKQINNFSKSVHLIANWPSRDHKSLPLIPLGLRYGKLLRLKSESKHSFEILLSPSYPENLNSYLILGKGQSM